MISEALHDTTDLAMNNGRFHGDNHLLVKFFFHPKKNTAKSNEAGRPIFEETPYVSIMQPGNKDSVIIRPATELDKQRFVEHWRRFEARENQEQFEGTLLDEWPGVTRSQCMELKYLNIRTVEQLANLADSNSQNVMGVAMLKQKAISYLETSNANATAERFAALEAKYEQLLATGSQKPKRKRRNKAEMAADKLAKEAAKAEKAEQE